MAADTCVSMDQWLRHPMAHTALDEILPCVDNATAQETLFQSKDVTYQLVGMVNMFINIANSNTSVGPFYYNQSGPSVPVLCNPFHPDKTDRKCLSSELELSNATQASPNELQTFNYEFETIFYLKKEGFPNDYFLL